MSASELLQPGSPFPLPLFESLEEQAVANFIILALKQILCNRYLPPTSNFAAMSMLVAPTSCKYSLFTSLRLR